MKMHPLLCKYELFATMPNGDKIPVANVKDGNLVIEPGCEDLFENLTSNPTSHINTVANTKIDNTLIKRLTDPMPDGGWKKGTLKDLEQVKGKTWKQAIDEHSGKR